MDTNPRPPNRYYPLLKSLAAKVGEYVYAEPKFHDFEGNLFRVRVKINVNKSLKNVVTLVKGKKQEVFIVRYECLPDLCAVCGYLGAGFKECSDGVHPPSVLVLKIISPKLGLLNFRQQNYLTKIYPG